ncbi:hypothetical protein CUMW_277800 [Citrus unshiu]|uniref:Peptidase S8/S53 domain-containing protein n=1 Tax=Citrus unshiu TaxID=55188 RepID=A0A2H5N432_CITUN|nr:hypothetical protein CUMW_277800 [Citrus unshiu]
MFSVAFEVNSRYSAESTSLNPYVCGVWPESKSFNDDGLGPVAKKVKGACVPGDNFTLSNCNSISFRSARDSDGHGTHTASTIAGAVVENFSLFGMARGTARGGAPSARLAIYKACWFNLCYDADILSALDDAINDVVDILSLSFGPSPPQPIYFEDSTSIGTFHAFQKGILVSASAGNSIFPGTATNVAPGILTVAASSVDWKSYSNIYLGNSKILKGSSLNPLETKTFYGLKAGGTAAASGVTATNASFCKNNTLDHHTLIKGKIVVCTIEASTDNRREKCIFVRESGGVGMILIDPNAKDIGFQFVIPATLIGQEEAQELQAYMTAGKNPIARIYPTQTILKTKPAPEMAAFSSTGPNSITADIIRPDITAPGVNILAEWSPVAIEATAERSVDYNIISGTSMSCPHVSAVAAIIKSHHPSWTTVLNNNQQQIRRDPNGSQTTPFDNGSGHINQVAAMNPGLIYDFDSHDIINFLCSTGATPGQLENLTGEIIHCQKAWSEMLAGYAQIGDTEGAVKNIHDS